ncbi:MAG TPA: hypothetical protein VMU07_03485 [Candidatus Paceibacterota bacterium]|nr:hypothetical protein [Candidatus Paceibacterota bacterium]
MNIKVRQRDRIGEIWILLSGMNFPMHAEDLEEKGDEVSFIRHVDGKDGKRTERITTQKQHIVYLAETIAAG